MKRNLLTTASRPSYFLSIAAEGAEDHTGGGSGGDVAASEVMYPDDAPEAPSEGGEGSAPKDDEEGSEGEPEGKEEDADGETPEYSPDDYDFTLPKIDGLVDDKGEPFQFADDDPYVAEFRDAFVENNISPDQVKALMPIYAKMQKDTAEAVIQSQKSQSDARNKAELTKLEVKLDGGKTMSPEKRIARLSNAADAVLGDGASKRLMSGLMGAESFVEVERLLEKANGGSLVVPTEDTTKEKSALDRMGYKT